MKIKYILPLLLVILFTTPTINAATTEKTITVGIELKAPFVIKKSKHYEGVCIDLWEKIADSLNINYVLKEYNLQNLLTAVENGEVDIAVSPLTVTTKRIQRVNFSQPYYITNLAFATKLDRDTDMISFVTDFFSVGFFKAFGSLFFIILIFGAIVWFFEKKKNPDQFREGIKGVGDGIWWSAVTMSTVGYGDKAPVTGIGRILGFVWMFTAVIVISGLTASVSSSLTVHKLKSQISTIDDLRKTTVGSVPGSGTSEFLEQYKIIFTPYNSIKEGLKAVDDDEIIAFVYDEAVLKYFVDKEKFSEIIKIIPSAYFKEYFSFATNNNELLRDVNGVLIDIIDSPSWDDDLEKYGIQYKD